ncbi:MAG: fused MFS/spermidine synthase [Alphaproteobacteria bacterium]|nr:fused MFS/spermidine synthase [Alphaproteobacteria bacterium]
MTSTSAGEHADTGLDLQRLLLLLLFAGSGCSALIYEIVWYHLLQLAIGSTAVSLGILLATFMGGLCLGSYLLPRFLPRARRHPLLVYAGIEGAIALCGLVELVLIPLIDRLYISGVQDGVAGMLLRGVVCAVALLPPTVLMGASLPAIVRWARGGADLKPSWWGLLYGANTFGAVIGCLLAGFWLLRVYDIRIATFAAAAINLAVAALSFALSRGPVVESEAVETSRGPRDWPVIIAIFCSGASALGAEIVWTRLMGLMFGATVYAFSIILAVFLAGLALGTAAASSLVKRVEPRTALGWCQILAALGMAWTAYVISFHLPYWPVDPLLSQAPRYTFEIDMARSIFAILPPALFWGAAFPLAFGAAAAGSDPGHTVGGLYAANTLGAIAGALLVSIVLVPWLGTLGSQRMLLGVAVLGGLVMLLPPLIKEDAWHSSAMMTFALFALGLLAWGMGPVPGELIAYGRRIATEFGYSTILFTGEGRNTSIAISRWNSNGALQFHVAGKVEASSLGVDMKLQRMLGHIPALMHGNPQSVLIVGFGAGVTAGSFTRYPGIKHIVICELEPLIPPTTTKWFANENYNVANDKRTQIHFDDARHFVLTTPEKFDIITSDPIHPFVKGSAALYSKEYFEMVKAHLNDGGIVTQWVPLYESDGPSVKSEIATFFQVFPGGMVFANTNGGQGYDVVLVGQKSNKPVDLGAINARLATAGYAPVMASLQDAAIPSALSLFATYAGSDADLKPWLADAAINHDYDMRLQYLAGLALNGDHADEIYRQMIALAKPPRGAFIGNGADQLFGAIQAGRAGGQ